MPVYMLQAGAFGDVKIGVATDPLARMKQLQTSMPKKLRLVRVLDGGPAEEKALHQRFAAHRLGGEWFRAAREMFGDVGLIDLPIPQSRRAPLVDLRSASGRWIQLQRDLVELVGGDIALARALGIPPWVTSRWWIHQEHLSAVIVLARQAGAPVTLGEALDAREASREEAVAAEKAKYLVERRKKERDWIKEHGAAAAWWALDPLSMPAEPPANSEAA